MFTWICPACSAVLTTHESAWQCDNGHNYDRAKSGYMNLLLPQHKSSKSPGDTKAMLQARKTFLETNHYLPVADEISKILNQEFGDNNAPMNLLDVGCGEGYFLQKIKEKLRGTWDTAGLDISKDGIQLAAKRDKTCTWVCGSSARIPIAENNIDALVRIFAPSNEDEILRTLSTNGLLIIVGPGAKHLIEIKESLYDTLRPYRDIDTPKGFKKVSSNEVDYQLTLENQETIKSLLSMTPFFWKGNTKKREVLLDKKRLCVRVNMNIYCYKKCA